MQLGRGSLRWVPIFVSVEVLSCRCATECSLPAYCSDSGASWAMPSHTQTMFPPPLTLLVMLYLVTALTFAVVLLPLAQLEAAPYSSSLSPGDIGRQKESLREKAFVRVTCTHWRFGC